MRRIGFYFLLKEAMRKLDDFNLVHEQNVQDSQNLDITLTARKCIELESTFRLKQLLTDPRFTQAAAQLLEERKSVKVKL